MHMTTLDWEIDKGFISLLCWREEMQTLNTHELAEEARSGYLALS
jgi:hypothetical protein